MKKEILYVFVYFYLQLFLHFYFTIYINQYLFLIFSQRITLRISQILGVSLKVHTKRTYYFFSTHLCIHPTSDALSQHKHNQTIPNIYTQYSHVQDRTSSLALFYQMNLVCFFLASLKRVNTHFRNSKIFFWYLYRRRRRGLRPGPVINSNAYFQKISISKVPILIFLTFSVFVPRQGGRAPPQTHFKFKRLLLENIHF